MSDFSKQDIEELRKLLADKRESLRVFRFGGAGSRTRNVRAGRNVRREIAQILTELRSRDLTVSLDEVPAKSVGKAKIALKRKKA
jgi:ribosomal protein L29